MMEDFSDLALPPLFGGHILEAELEAAGVELTSGGTEILQSGGPSHVEQKEIRDLEKKKYHGLQKRVKELEQVNEKILARLHHIQRLTRRLKRERRFLMKTLDAYGDDYRNAALTIPLEEESTLQVDNTPGGDDDDGTSPSTANQSGCVLKKKRHRVPKEKERDAQVESDPSVTTETSFPPFQNPNSLSH